VAQSNPPGGSGPGREGESARKRISEKARRVTGYDALSARRSLDGVARQVGQPGTLAHGVALLVERSVSINGNDSNRQLVSPKQLKTSLPDKKFYQLILHFGW